MSQFLSSSLTVKSLEKDDVRLLSTNETAFIFLRGDTSSIRLLTSCEEVFGRNQVRLKIVKFAATDMLGVGCHHCKEALEDPADMVVIISKAKVRGCLHEGCFRKWFVQADKNSLQPYRFLSAQRAMISSGDGMTKVLVDGTAKDGAVEISLVKNVDFAEIRQSDSRASEAVEKRQLNNDDRPGINLFLCPRCTAPQEIPFLETEEKIHTCKKCQGRFKVIVKEVR